MQNGNTVHIWKLLNTIPDPEIPVISIVELGVIRDVTFTDKSYTILITPTYSGCPAVKTFTDDIKECLKENGVRNFKLKLIYSPAWTTDWINAQTKEKLRAFGIAPPVGKVLSKKSLLANETVACPQCRSENTKIKSMFGSTACKAFYTCSDCLEPFDYFKCI